MSTNQEQPIVSKVELDALQHRLADMVHTSSEAITVIARLREQAEESLENHVVAQARQQELIKLRKELLLAREELAELNRQLEGERNCIQSWKMADQRQQMELVELREQVSRFQAMGVKEGTRVTFRLNKAPVELEVHQDGRELVVEAGPYNLKVEPDAANRLRVGVRW